MMSDFDKETFPVWATLRDQSYSPNVPYYTLRCQHMSKAGRYFMGAC